MLNNLNHQSILGIIHTAYLYHSDSWTNKTMYKKQFKTKSKCQDDIALFEVFGQYHNQMVLISYYGCPNNQPKLEHNLKEIFNQ